MISAKVFIIYVCLLGCAIGISGQANQYPNEIKDYEFFGSGRLKDLKLAASSANDVVRVFGEKCGRRCDLDSNWVISFKYFDDIWVKTSRNDKGELDRYLLDSRYLGKLRSIEIRPKGKVSFLTIQFPSIFERLVNASTADARSGNNSMTVNDAFSDSDGLSYEVYSRTNYDDIKNKNTKLYDKGDLVLIRYAISRETEKSLFVLQK